MADDPLAAHDVAFRRADNPGPFSLTGTNTWLLGRDPSYVVDPGPALDAHIAAVAAEAEARGGLGGIAVTHDHADHVEGVGALRERAGAVPVAAARGEVDVILGDGDAFGPLTAIATPGHALDHLAFVAGKVCFSGDAVLGEGSVIIVPDGGGLGPYLAALERLRSLDLEVICPGHGPIVTDPKAKLTQYIDHRLDRERRLLEGLAAGGRTEEELLDAAWDDVPESMRPAAGLSLRTHLAKLAGEDRLPPDLRVDY